MVRSHWLRVCGARLGALFRLAFAPAPGLRSLSLAAHRNSQVYSTKDTPQAIAPATSCRSMVSGSVSLPLQGFFSPFPHGTPSLSVAAWYLALDRGRPGFRRGSSCPALLRNRIMEGLGLRLRGCHPLRPRFPAGSAGLSLCHSTGHPHAALQPRSRRFGLLPFRSPLLGESLLVSFPGLLRWFTSPGVASPPYFIQARDAGIPPSGLPHSVIRGSRDMCSSPRLFAACRDLHRPAAPRHPPWTYSSLGHIVLPPASTLRGLRASNQARAALRSLPQALHLSFPVDFKDLFS